MATSSAIPLTDDELSVIVRALGLMAQSMRRAAKATHSDEVRAIQERDAGRVDALSAKFR